MQNNNNQIININPTLTSKQKQALKILLNHENGITELLYGGAAGGGKAQTLSSKILTPNGWTTMGQIKLGDEVYTPEGNIAKVIAIHPQGVKQIYKVTFIDGRTAYVCGEHLWNSKEIRIGKEKVRNTLQIKGLIESGKNISIPLINNFEFGIKYENKFNAYLIGCLLGDGGLTNSVTLTTADKQMLDIIQSELPENFIIKKINDKYGYRITTENRTTTPEGYPSNELKNYLVKLGLHPIGCEDKFIPKVFLNADYKTRLGIIQGLMDTDGTVDSRGHLSFCNKSKQLVLDLQYLIRSIGGKATLSTKIKSCVYKGEKKTGTYYEIYINTKINKQLFRLDRKKERCENKYNGGRGTLANRIISITEHSNEEAQCITIDSINHLYITDDFIVTHNSYLGCLWLIICCIKYPNSRWLMGRSKLTTLKKTTLKSFFEVCQKLNIKENEHYKYNQINNEIKFFNGSEIILKDLFSYPSDPDFDSLGSLEIAGAFIDECNQISEKAKNIVMSRIRHKLDEFGISPKLFMSCNPSRNWVYNTFYKKTMDNTIEFYKMFIPALNTDNQYISKHYITNLERQDEVTKRRLLYGNWDYEDELALFKYDNILEMFEIGDIEIERIKETNIPIINCFSIDVARLGKDKTCITIWNNLNLIEIIELSKKRMDEQRNIINDLKIKYNVQNHQIIFDVDGVGGGLADMFQGSIEIVNNSKALNNENYQNLKTQLYFKLAEKINNNEIKVFCKDENIKLRLTQELQIIKREKVDNDNKIQMTSKEQMKNQIGRSPDIADSMAYRMKELINSFELPSFF